MYKNILRRPLVAWSLEGECGKSAGLVEGASVDGEGKVFSRSVLAFPRSEWGSCLNFVLSFVSQPFQRPFPQT